MTWPVALASTRACIRPVSMPGYDISCLNRRVGCRKCVVGIVCGVWACSVGGALTFLVVLADLQQGCDITRGPRGIGLVFVLRPRLIDVS